MNPEERREKSKDTAYKFVMLWCALMYIIMLCVGLDMTCGYENPRTHDKVMGIFLITMSFIAVLGMVMISVHDTQNKKTKEVEKEKLIKEFE